MSVTRHCKSHFAFTVATIFSLCLQIRANHTEHPRAKYKSYLSTITQNISENQSTTEASTNLTTHDTSVTTFEMQTAAFQSSTFGQEPSTSSPGFNLTSAVQDPLTTTKPHITTKTENCEEKNKSLILICFIIIAVLVLACTFLFLSTVVMANKISYLKRAKQGKRMPRGNGDFLVTSSLWPAGSDTWQKKSKELTGTDLMMQDLISETAIAAQKKNAVETTEKLTSGRANHQNKEEASKPCDSIITNFIVEI
uniref:Ecotropic viral integration site 2A n=2 Tax=Chelonoidis abingdonii TaxID=106734 RepID=A0A8C0QMP8_CHEAB